MVGGFTLVDEILQEFSFALVLTLGLGHQVVKDLGFDPAANCLANSGLFLKFFQTGLRFGGLLFSFPPPFFEF